MSHLRKAHLPEDLLYDAMIESSYDNDDSSSAGALGLWQFMPQNGKIYGLRMDRWVDERRDPLRSTIAMMDYWQDLYQRFGEWQIALAAFNVGYGAVLRSIARYNTNDYYALCDYENGMPWETCLYTPKVLAAAIVGHNRAVFGYGEIKETPPEQWDEVAVPTSMTFAMIARVAGSTEATIKQLNPQLRRGRTPPGEAGYIVRVPAGAKPEFAKKLAELAERLGWLRRVRARARRAARGCRDDLRHDARAAAQAQRRRSRSRARRRHAARRAARDRGSARRRTRRRRRPSCSAPASIRRTASS